MTCLRDLRKEKIVLENQIVSMSLKEKNRRVTDDREKDLMKSAMYNVSYDIILFILFVMLSSIIVKCKTLKMQQIKIIHVNTKNSNFHDF